MNKIWKYAVLFFETVLIVLVAFLLCKENDDFRVKCNLESGFYAEDTQVILSAAEGERIFYTLDGTKPTPSTGKQYTGPLSLKKLCNRKAEFANRTDVSTGFLKDVIAQRGLKDPEYMAPETVDCGVILQAIAVDENGICGNILQRDLYLQDGKALTLPVLSVSVNPDDFFGKQGIYVRGETFEQDPEGAMYNTDWPWWAANYHLRGIEQEKLANISYFDTTGACVYESPVGIRISGGSSRGYAQKSMRLFARREYGGLDTFSYDFFGDGKSLHTVTLSSGGNDYNTHIKDVLAQSLLAGGNFATQQMRPCVVYVEGEYWGLYYISENYDQTFVKETYGVDKENVIMVSDSEVVEGFPEDIKYWDEVVWYVQNTDLSIPENYEKLDTMIDMESFISYYCAQLYLGRRIDWPEENCMLWRTRKKGHGQYNDGRWRYMLFDLNTEYGAMSNPDSDCFDSCYDKDLLFRYLLKSDIFCQKCIETIYRYAENELAVDKALLRLDELSGETRQEVLKTYKRYFGENKTKAVYEEGIAQIQSFFVSRGPFLVEEMQHYFAK